MDRITVSREELAKTLTVWLAVAGVKQPSMIRDLWTRKDERADDRKREHARRMLAQWIANQFAISRHEVTRPAPSKEPLFGHKLPGQP